jgi:YbbR domain-containing protein
LLNGRKLLVKVVENWPAKGLSIALAIILFVFHRMSMLEDRFFSVPLILETSSNLVPASSYPRMIRVSLRGDANSIYPILEDDIEVYLDLTKYTKEGRYRAPVQVRKKGTALGINALEISVDPLEVSLDLDQKISKLVPVTPNFRGYLEPGYELASYSLSPNQVVVDGPLKAMNGLSGLLTEFIELDGRRENFSNTVRIMNRDPLLIIRGDGTTEFRGFIQELLMIRTLEDMPLTARNLDERLTVELETGTGSVRVEGEQLELEAYEPSAFALFLDYSGIGQEGSYTLPVQAELPEGIALIQCDPEEVTVQVRVKADPEAP